MENLKPINFRSLEGQLLALEAVNWGDLRYVDAYRLCFPEDEKTLESMELRELIDNHICMTEG